MNVAAMKEPHESMRIARFLLLFLFLSKMFSHLRQASFPYVVLSLLSALPWLHLCLISLLGVVLVVMAVVGVITPGVAIFLNVAAVILVMVAEVRVLCGVLIATRRIILLRCPWSSCWLLFMRIRWFLFLWMSSCTWLLSRLLLLL